MTVFARDYGALVAYLAAREAMPFGWWTNDCVTYGAGAVLAQTGVDLLAGQAPWTSEARALAAIAALGGLEAIVDAHLPEIPRAHALRGDIGAVIGLRGPLLVVIEGDTLAGPDLKGVRRLPRQYLRKAWSAVPKAPQPFLGGAAS
jgi:hypothetical protein